MPAALLLLLCLSCNSLSRKDGTVAADSVAVAAGYEDQSPQAPTGKGTPKGNVPPSPSSPAAHPDWDKKIVKTADLSI